MSRCAYTVTLVRDGSMCHIPVTIDPVAVFGRVRAPVKVTLNGYTFRSTIAAMGGELFLPLRRSNREAAGLEGTETLEVGLELDTEVRAIEPPPDLAKALKKRAGALAAWSAMAFTHQREWADAVADAKKPETRARRIEQCVEKVAALGAAKSAKAAKQKPAAKSAKSKSAKSKSAKSKSAKSTR